MIGNDVIDLRLAASESDWRRNGYLQKLFSDSEITLILASQAPQLSVWNLWSRKEAAYKIFNRSTGIRSFNPHYFSCANLDLESEVRFGDSFVYSKTEITSEFIHTICVTQKQYFDSIKEISKSQIHKQNGLPFHICEAKKNPATVSHHGRFEFCIGLFGYRLDFDFARQRAMDGTFLGNFE